MPAQTPDSEAHPTANPTSIVRIVDVPLDIAIGEVIDRIGASLSRCEMHGMNVEELKFLHRLLGSVEALERGEFRDGPPGDAK